ncbi:MAG: hypothetical protein EPO24_13310, partial [Bacteroidetes bacterium]
MSFFNKGFLEEEAMVLSVAGASSIVVALVSFFGKTMNITFLALPVIVAIAARYFFLQESHNLNSFYSIVAILIVTGT